MFLDAAVKLILDYMPPKELKAESPEGSAAHIVG